MYTSEPYLIYISLVDWLRILLFEFWQGWPVMMTIAVFLDNFWQGYVDLLDATRHLMALDTTLNVLLRGPVEVVCFEPAM